MNRKDEVTTDGDTEEHARMSEELVALLRQRVATRYYDQPHVVDAIARALLSARPSTGSAARELH
jgi:hypothetical protein